MKQPLISIIVPVYNTEQFIRETIESVQSQTYTNWELLMVDDASTDKSIEVINGFQQEDGRIKLIHHKYNQGVAKARNTGIEMAKGVFIAFLDADDLWAPTKLTQQLEFMQNLECAFSFTGYQFADEKGIANGPIVAIPATMRYKDALKNTTIWTSTVMFNLDKIKKQAIQMPSIPSEDMATWWRILRSGYVAYGLQSTLSLYRRSGKTLSSNKFTAIKRTWSLYRMQEKLTIPQSLYYFCWYIFNATLRRI